MAKLMLFLMVVFTADPKLFNFAEQEDEEKVSKVAAERVEQQTVLQRVQKENEQLRTSLKAAQAQITKLQQQPLTQIEGVVNSVKTIQRPVQFVITTSDGCQACHTLISHLIRVLEPKGWTIDEEESSQFYIKNISAEEWRRQQLTLPHVVLRVRDTLTVIYDHDPTHLASMYLKYVEVEKKMPPLASEQLQGMKVASIEGKQQVIQMLQTLEPFLDGGTLQIIYTAKPGVVKNFLTIKQGSLGVKIPPRISFLLKMRDGDLTVTVQEPRTELIIGPLVRGIQEINFTPNKISLRLPWMIDPELELKDSPR